MPMELLQAPVVIRMAPMSTWCWFASLHLNCQTAIRTPAEQAEVPISDLWVGTRRACDALTSLRGSCYRILSLFVHRSPCFRKNTILNLRPSQNCAKSSNPVWLTHFAMWLPNAECEPVI